MQRSYSKKAFSWDNACIESFHSIIKREWLNRFKIRDYKQAYQLIFEYLEAFYNTKRIHSHCNYMPPNEFERVYKRTHTEAELLRVSLRIVSVSDYKYQSARITAHSYLSIYKCRLSDS